jgi:hypothetical protein
MATLNLRHSDDEFIPEEIAQPQPQLPHSSRKWKKFGRRGLFAVVLVALGILLWAVFSPSPWRAVFLSNNQVYFGKFHDWPMLGSITLTNVYYLQVQPALQPPQAGTVVSIVKLGNEIHAPKDKMVIPKTQILFWEDLRDDSPVLKNIESLQK